MIVLRMVRGVVIMRIIRTDFLPIFKKRGNYAEDSNIYLRGNWFALICLYVFCVSYCGNYKFICIIGLYTGMMEEQPEHIKAFQKELEDL